MCVCLSVLGMLNASCACLICVFHVSLIFELVVLICVQMCARRGGPLTCGVPSRTRTPSVELDRRTPKNTNDSLLFFFEEIETTNWRAL